MEDLVGLALKIVCSTTAELVHRSLILSVGVAVCFCICFFNFFQGPAKEKNN